MSAPVNEDSDQEEGMATHDVGMRPRIDLSGHAGARDDGVHVRVLLIRGRKGV
jgi:hypothetical protein